MSVFKKIVEFILGIFGVVKADPSQVDSRIEQSPIEVYRNIIAKKTQAYNKLKSASIQINGQVQILRQELQALSDEYALIDQELDYALMHGDDEAALELLKIRDNDDKNYEQKKALHEAFKLQAQGVMKQISQVQSELSDLKIELQQVEADEVAVEVQRLVDKFKTDKDVQSLSAVRDAVAQRRAEAEVDQVLRDNSFDSKRAEIQRNIAARQSQQKHEMQLDRLKQHWRQNKLAQSS